MCAKRFGVEIGAAFADDECDELVDAVIRAQHDGCMRDARQMGQRGFDFAEFDAEASDLDLIIDAATKTDIAIAIEDNRVAGAIKNGVGAVAVEGIVDELVARQFIALQVALGDARSADQ